MTWKCKPNKLSHGVAFGQSIFVTSTEKETSTPSIYQALSHAVLGAKDLKDVKSLVLKSSACRAQGKDLQLVAN